MCGFFNYDGKLIFGDSPFNKFDFFVLVVKKKKIKIKKKKQVAVIAK